MRKRRKRHIKHTAQQLYEMRQQGATLVEIGDKFCLSKQRISQVLRDKYGNAEIKTLINTKTLCIQSGCHPDLVSELLKSGKISLVYERINKKSRLWDPSIIPLVKELIIRRCTICGKSLDKLDKLGKTCEEHRKVKLICYVCGTEYKILRSIYNIRLKRNYKHSFCTQKCLGIYMGKHYGFAVHPPTSKHNYEEVYKLRKEGYKPIEIGKKLKISIWTIYLILKKGGYGHVIPKLVYEELIPIKYYGGDKMEKYPYDATIIKQIPTGRVGKYDFLSELIEQLEEGQAISLKLPSVSKANTIAVSWRTRCALMNKVGHVKRVKKDDYYLMYLTSTTK